MSEKHFMAALAYMMVKKAATEAAETVSNEWRQKQDDWQDRQEENLERWTQSYNRTAEKIYAIEQNMIKLDGMIENAGNENYRAKVMGWKADQNCRRLELQSKNSALQQKIESVQSKLSSSHSQTPWFYREGNNSTRPFRINTQTTSMRTNIRSAGNMSFRDNGPLGGRTMTFTVPAPKKKW